MRNSYPISKSLLALAVVGASLSACKDDDESSPNTVSFVNSSLSVNEGDGTVEVEVKLDRAADQDIVVGYDISGTAKDRETTGASGSYDFQISSDRGELTIPKGESSATINIAITQDAIFEEDETIELELSEASNNVKISESKNAIVATLLDDETAEGRPKISFAVATVTLNEVDGLEGYTNVRVILDKPAPEALTLNYSLGGTAMDSLTAFENPNLVFDFDYFINSEEVGVLEIPKGATEAVIEIQINPIEFEYEPVDEIIALRLDEVSASAQLGTQKLTQIVIQEQDGEVVELNWPTSYTDVDMDLVLWSYLGGTNFRFRTASALAADQGPERLHIPDILSDGTLGFDLAAFGFSYSYYEGTQTPMNFTVKVLKYTDGVLQAANAEGVPTTTATYTLANILDTDKPGVIAQVLVFENGEYSDKSDEDIYVADESSRMRAPGVGWPAGGIRKR